MRSPYKHKYKSILLKWIPALLWASVIVFLSTRPTVPNIGPRFPYWDKVAHIVIYFFLGWLVGRALLRGHSLKLSQAMVLGVVVVAIFGVTDEFHQSFHPGRHAGVSDWFADLAGAALGQIALWYDARSS